MQTCAGRLIFSPDKGERLVSCSHASFNPIKPLGLKGGAQGAVPTHRRWFQWYGTVRYLVPYRYLPN
jgi:hypothetical protein